MEAFDITVEGQIFSVIPNPHKVTNGIFLVLDGEEESMYIFLDQDQKWVEVDPETGQALELDYDDHVTTIGRLIENHYV